MDTRKNKMLQAEALKKLHGKDRLQYIWDYYKLPLFCIFVFVYIIGYILYGHFTHKEPVLYAAFVNVNASEKLTKQLTSDFLDYLEGTTSKSEFYSYTGLYLTDNESNPYFEYTYASRMKILGAVDSEKLDVVLMNKEAFDAFSQSGYLCDLEKLLLEKTPDFYKETAPYLVENIIILEDNSDEVQLDSSIEYQAEIEEHSFGLDLSKAGFVSEAGFDDIMYLGVIENSPRKERAIQYMQYILFN